MVRTLMRSKLVGLMFGQTTKKRDSKRLLYFALHLVASCGQNVLSSRFSRSVQKTVIECFEKLEVLRRIVFILPNGTA